MHGPDDAIPSALGGFRIERELGRGAMGVVYRGRDPRTGELAAIKVLRSPTGAGERTLREHQDRFFAEARAAGRLDHENVVRVFDAGEDAGTGAIWIAMELVEGQDLAGLIDEKLTLERLSTIISELGSALDHAHSRGIIHRDVKPTNVLIDDAGRVRLSDFGVARLTGLSLTAPGVVLGSPAYMAPEQVRGDAVSAQTDVHALGVVLYEGVTGRCPFAAETEIALAEAIVSWAPDKERLKAAGISPEIEAVIEKALEKDPAMRFETASALAEAFAKAVAAMTGRQPRSPAARSGCLLSQLAAPVLLAISVVTACLAVQLSPSSARDDHDPAHGSPGNEPTASLPPEFEHPRDVPVEGSPDVRPPEMREMLSPALLHSKRVETQGARVGFREATELSGDRVPSPSRASLKLVVATRQDGTLVVAVDGEELFRGETRQLVREQRGLSFLKRRTSALIEVPFGEHEFSLQFVGRHATLTTTEVATISPEGPHSALVNVSLRNKRIELSFD